MLGASILLGVGIGALSHAIALRTRAQETLIAVSQGIILPMTFLSTVFMVPALMPDWMATVAAYNPLTWAADASRIALSATPEWPAVAMRLVWLAAFAAVGLVIALRSFRTYRRSA